MKILLYTLVCLLFGAPTFGQITTPLATSTQMLSPSEVKQLLTNSVKSQFNVAYDIFRVYSVSDKTGKFYLVLTENIDRITPKKDTLHHKIKAFNLKSTPKGLEKQWEIYDYVLTDDVREENTIWFWTKYSSFQDLDKDGLCEPILVYGTSGVNGFDSGRVKIGLFYKGQKIFIRHQNGVMDEERNTQVDKLFYTLPMPIQNHVKSLMQKMTENNHAIFPAGWQEAMKKHQLHFDENG